MEEGKGKASAGGWVLLALILISSELFFTLKSSDYVGSHTTLKHGTNGH